MPANPQQPFSVQLFQPASDIGPQVPLHFVVYDQDSQPLDVFCEYNFNGGGYKPAKLATTSDQLNNLPAPFLGADYRLIWDAAADLGMDPQGNPQKGDVTLRMTPKKAGAPGLPAETASFHVDTSAKPAAALLTPKVPVTVGAVTPVTVTSANQTGIAGQLLPEALQARVTDSQGNPLAGVRVSFKPVVAAGAQPLVRVEQDLGLTTTTNGNGVASARLRAISGVQGSGAVEARVVGSPSTPGNVAAFKFTINQAKIVTLNTITATLDQGGAEIQVTLDGDGDPNTVDFTPDVSRPIKLVIESDGVRVSRREMHIPDPMFLNNVSASFTVEPAKASGNASVKVTCINDTAVVPLPPITWQIKTTWAKRKMGPDGSTKSDVPLALRLKSGSDPSGSPQVGYPGLTLAKEFVVDFVDDQGNAYDRSAARYDCGSPPINPPALRLRFETHDGALSTTASVGTDSRIDADTQTKVYFTPLVNRGPWRITVSTLGSVFDPLPQDINETDPSDPLGTHQRCSHYPVEVPIIGLVTSFVAAQEPSDIHFITESTAGTQTVSALKAGGKVRLEVSGLSQTVAGNPIDFGLSTILVGAGVEQTPPNYVGLTAPFKQKLALKPAGAGVLRSDEILIIQGDPVITSTSPLKHSVIPGGWLGGDDGNPGPPLRVEVLGRRLERVISGDSEPIQETIAGTSPVGGAAGSVVLSSGEFLYRTCDLDFVSRGGAITFCRTFRAFVRGDGPLGPGWFSEHFSFLDVSSLVEARGSAAWALRWWSRTGRYEDLPWPGNALPKGLFVDLRLNDSTIDPDHSAVQM